MCRLRRCVSLIRRWLQAGAAGVLLCLVGCSVIELDRSEWPCRNDSVCGSLLVCRKICDQCEGRCRKPGDPAPCVDGTTRDCEIQGAGDARCKSSALCTKGFWGPCRPLQTPPQEICDNIDNDCDGQIDEGLARSCYTGPDGTKGEGSCKAGVQLCALGAWGRCNDEITPAKEDRCGSRLDEDCDGTVPDPGHCAWVSLPPFPLKVELGARFAEHEGALWLTGWLDANASRLLTWGGKQLRLAHPGAALFVVQLDPTGTPSEFVSFQSHTQGASIQGKALIRDEQGQLFVAGTFTDRFDFGGGLAPLVSRGKADVFLLKLSPALVPMWAYSFGGPDQDEVVDLRFSSDGKLLVAGSFVFSMEAEDPSSGRVTKITSHGDRDVFVLKVQDEGSLSWLQHVGGKGADDPGTASALAPDEQGGCYLVGAYAKTYEATFGAVKLPPSRVGSRAFIVALDAQGKVTWAKGASGDGSDASAAEGVTRFVNGSDVVLTIAGTYQDQLHAFSESTKLPATTGPQDDVFMVQMSTDGDVLFAQRSGSVLGDSVGAMALRPDGRVLVAGTFSTDGSFGGRTLSVVNGTDIYLQLWRHIELRRWVSSASSVGGAANDRVEGALFGSDGQHYLIGRCLGRSAAQLDGLQVPCTNAFPGQWYVWKPTRWK